MSAPFSPPRCRPVARGGASSMLHRRWLPVPHRRRRWRTRTTARCPSTCAARAKARARTSAALRTATTAPERREGGARANGGVRTAASERRRRRAKADPRHGRPLGSPRQLRADTENILGSQVCGCAAGRHTFAIAHAIAGMAVPASGGFAKARWRWPLPIDDPQASLRPA